MMILIGAAASSWRYLAQDDKEQELYFRGDQIARAIEEYQRKNGNTFPPSFDVLVKGKFLRRAYKDPMTKDGKWRIVRPGEVTPAAGAPGGGIPGLSGLGASPRPSPSPSTAFPLGATGGIGVMAGVASTNKNTSLRMFNGRTKYDQWLFVAGQPRQLGKNVGPSPLGPGGTTPGGMPQTGLPSGIAPLGLPSPR
jgi:type II secretory pathway pseudopilin PulG